MPTVEVTFEIELPDLEHTEQQLEEFLRFSLGDNGMMDGTNPFSHCRVDPIFGTFEYEVLKP